MKWVDQTMIIQISILSLSVVWFWIFTCDLSLTMDIKCNSKWMRHISGILAKRHLVMQQQNHLTELKCRAKNNIRKRTWRICVRDISKQQSDITDIRVSGNRCMCLMKMKMPIMESLKAGLRTNGSICFFKLRNGNSRCNLWKVTETKHLKIASKDKDCTDVFWNWQ